MSVIKRKRKSIYVRLILSFLLSFASLLASIGGFSHVLEQANYSSKSATIVDVDVKHDGRKPRTKNRCSPIVEFQVDGMTYKSGPDRYSTFGTTESCAFNVGDQTDIRYDPSDPNKATMRDSSFDLNLGVIAGILALIFGIILPARIIKSDKETLETSL